jgi:tRNA (mo5U34)-methyltransferase
MKCGFTEIRLLSCTITSTNEQRRTNWIKSRSLEDFLDPSDSSKTKEGYPMPYRAI